MITQKYLDELTYEVVGSAIEVHKFMGRGLLESVYHQCLIEELKHRKINFLTEMKVPVIYKGKSLDINFRCDLFIENCIVLELKAIEIILPIHHAQLMTYMKLLESPKGILYNFHSVNLYKDGQKTFVNEYFKKLEKE
jgi:GxxExxY protein